MRLQHEHGFTLVDLLIAVVILGIVALVATPQLSGFLRGYRLQGAAQLVWVDLQRARALAIKEGTTMRVDFTPTIYVVVRPATNEVRFRRDLARDYSGITVEVPTNSVAFTSTGAALPPSRTVEIQGPGGSRRVTILPTGFIGSPS
jgi:type IV fimbrial biogenesis protein FimT